MANAEYQNLTCLDQDSQKHTVLHRYGTRTTVAVTGCTT